MVYFESRNEIIPYTLYLYNSFKGNVIENKHF